jgi:hypothetical protein
MEGRMVLSILNHHCPIYETIAANFIQVDLTEEVLHISYPDTD